MPIVLKSELCNMKWNGYEDFKQYTDSEKHTNGTDDAQNFPAEVLVSDDVPPECSLCGITFDSRRDYETHFLSLEHAQKVLEQNNFITLSSDTYNKLTSPLKNQSEGMCVDEIDKQEQQEKSPCSSKTDNENKVLKPPTYSCSYCIMKFSGPEPYKQHMESKSHKKKVALNNNSFAEIKKIDGHMFCDICKKEFTGEKPYTEHLISKKHKMMEQHFQFFENNSDNDSPKAKKIKIEPRSEIDKQFFCETCKMSCSGPIPFSAHLAGRAHKKNVARSRAGVNIKPSANQLYPFPNNNNMNHVNIAAINVSGPACTDGIANISPTLEKIGAEREENKMEIDNPKPAWFCRVCNVQCSGPIDFSHHLGGKSHKKKDMYQKGNDCNKLKDFIDSDGSKSDVYGSTGESSFCSQKQNMCSENFDYEGELKKSVEIYSPDEEINFD